MASSSTYSAGNAGATYPCPHCNGSGTVNDNQGNPVRCPICYGNTTLTHKAYRKYMDSQPLTQVPAQVRFVDCPQCSATKQIQDEETGKLIDCPLCNAKGYVEEEKRKKWLDEEDED